MARYIDPVCRLCRRYGDKLMLKGGKCLGPKCTVEKRTGPPGQKANRRRRMSDRGMQLREKQKARFTYGLMEQQFRSVFEEAERLSGITGDNLVMLLERRLDNVVYRLGFADSRAQARQLVQHGHIALNGHKTDIPSALVSEGDTVGFQPTAAKTEYYKMVVETIESKAIPAWLALDRPTLVGRVVSLPTPDDAGAKFSGKTIVEFYSR